MQVEEAHPGHDGEDTFPPLPGDELPFYHLRLTAPMPPPRGYPRELRTVGDHLKKVRLLKGLFQAETATALGVSGETIKNWETGKHAPRADLRERIICFLGYDPGDWTGSSADGCV